ncbi:MAG: DnaJ domain-containing protein [Candidatus Limnocylindrales bacterium]
MTSTANHDAYAILGVARGADDGTIAAAYRALARRHHPDVAGDRATRRMMRINAAFDAIRTAELRLEYEAYGADTDFDRAPAASRGGTRPGAAGERPRPYKTPERDGTGAAGRPPGRPSGSVLDFGRHIGWSLGEIARVDPGYLVWLAEKRDGRHYVAEIDALLKQIGYEATVQANDTAGSRRGGRFRRS